MGRKVQPKTDEDLTPENKILAKKWDKIYGRFIKDTEALIKEAGGTDRLNVSTGKTGTIYDFCLHLKG